MNEQSNRHERALELINGRIDGELIESEEAELDALLASSEELGHLHDEWKEFAGVLDQVPDQQPPAYLEDAIISQVRAPRPNGADADEPLGFSAWLASHWLRTGVAVAAGVLLTVGIYQTGNDFTHPEDVTDMSGTIVKSPATSNGALIDSVQVSSGLLQGNVELRQREGQYLLYVRIDSQGRASLNVNFSASKLQLEDISGASFGADSVVVNDESVNITTTGPKHYQLVLEQVAGLSGPDETDLGMNPLVLSFYAGASLVKTHQLGKAEQVAR